MEVVGFKARGAPAEANPRFTIETSKVDPKIPAWYMATFWIDSKPLLSCDLAETGDFWSRMN